MARSTSPSSRSTDAPRDAIALLKQDHRTVSALFEEFEKADAEVQSLKKQKKAFTNALLEIDADGEPPATVILGIPILMPTFLTAPCPT